MQIGGLASMSGVLKLERGDEEVSLMRDGKVVQRAGTSMVTDLHPMSSKSVGDWVRTTVTPSDGQPLPKSLNSWRLGKLWLTDGRAFSGAIRLRDQKFQVTMFSPEQFNLDGTWQAFDLSKVAQAEFHAPPPPQTARTKPS